VAKLVTLSGFMGSGKSAVGAAVAARLDCEFVDLDEAVVKATGTAISDFFATIGEQAFRAEECHLLEEALENPSRTRGLVVSLGGGTLASEEAALLMHGRGGLVFLDVDVDVAWERSRGTGRPLAQSREAFSLLYQARRENYERMADWIIPVGIRTVDQIAADIVEIVQGTGQHWQTLWGRRLGATARESLIVGGKGALSFLEGQAGAVACGGGRLFVITDENVQRAWGPAVVGALGGGTEIATLVVEAGEASKSHASLGRCWEWLAREGARRDDVVVALGGGVVGDLAGFAAATYQRGIGLWQIPTSLLAQVDSSVGGKTAVNLAAGKNLVGAFYQPDLVVVDVTTLSTLPEDDYQGGLGEVVKHALLMSPDAFAGLERDAEAVAKRDADILQALVRADIDYKAGVVQRDEREGGVRAVLNLGHTTAHALEVTAGYGRISHGQAVALGLLVALAVSEELLGLDPGIRQRTLSLLLALGLRTAITLPSAEELWAATSRDKKARAGSTGFVGLTALGEPVWGLNVSRDLYTRSLQVIRA
jgi:shikimate kinase/3-dehydroquinate synthase